MPDLSLSGCSDATLELPSRGTLFQHITFMSFHSYSRTGWGLRTGYTQSTQLREAQLLPLASETCKRNFEFPAPDKEIIPVTIGQICTQSTLGSTTCKGERMIGTIWTISLLLSILGWWTCHSWLEQMDRIRLLHLLQENLLSALDARQVLPFCLLLGSRNCPRQSM